MSDYRLCRTCPQPLDSVSRAQGCQRCKACRAKQPGRVYRRVEQKRKPLKPQQRGRRFGGQIELTIHPRGRKEALTSKVSWWTLDEYRSDRAAFQQKANELHPINSQYNQIPMSPAARVPMQAQRLRQQES